MKKKKSLKLKILLLAGFLAVATALFALNVYSAVTLEVTPYEGGLTLNFGKVVTGENISVSKEVTIRAGSDLSGQYQVFQRVLEPLVNEKGEQLDPQAITFYAINGSNASGNLYQETPSGLIMGEQLVYSSNQQGENDSFIFVYMAHPDKFNAFGNFMGKIVYTIRPLSGAEPQEVYLTVVMETAGDFKVETETSSLSDKIELKVSGQKLAPKEPGEKDIKETNENQGFLKISFKGNPETKINIYQELEILPQNEAKEDLASGSISFFTPVNSDVNEYNAPSILEANKKALLYSSRKNDDDVIINFIANAEKLINQKTGNYAARIKYTIERDGAEEKTVYFNLVAIIAPVFEVEATLPDGGIKFADILPNSEPQIKEVTITIRSNTGKPYIITQKLLNDLTNEDGDKFSLDHFALKTELAENQAGKGLYPEFKSLTMDETPVFFSDEKGAPGSFKVHYRLTAYPKIRGGSYATEIKYSLGEK